MKEISFEELKNINEKFRDFLVNERKMKKNTVDCYMRDIKFFFAFCEQNNYENTEDLDKYVAEYTLHLKNSGKSASLISRNIASLRKLFRYLKDKDFMGKNPTKGMKYEKNISEKKDDILTTDEIDRILDSAKGDSLKAYRDYAILEVLYACGIKVSELIGLKISDMFLDDGYIEVKSENHRYIPIYKEAVKAVKNYLNKSRKYILNKKNKNDFVFLNKNGEPLSRQGLWKILKTCAEAANINKTITPHTFRKSMAIHLLENGADIYDVQAMLGHKRIELTKDYLKDFSPVVTKAYLKAHPKA